MASDDLALVMRSGGELDPSSNSASRSLSALNLDANTDFDAGIRILRGQRTAAAADKVSANIQGELLDKHSRSARDATGCITGLPSEVAQVLGAEDWQLQPHDVGHSTFKHFRGSFPLAVEAAATLGKANSKVMFNVAMAAKLRSLRTELHKPATHDEAPPITREEATIHKSDCNSAGFCVHGSDGRDVVAMRLSLRKALTRTRFPKANKLGRELLSTSGIVIAAIAEEPIIAAVGVAAEAVPAVRVHNHWLHLGAFDLKRVEFEGQTLCISGCGLTINGECAEVNLEGQ